MNINKKNTSFWIRIKIDPIFIGIIICLLIYSIVIFWSASGQNYELMNRKIIQIVIGLVTMIVMAQIPPRIYEKCASYVYLLSTILLIIVDTFGHISKGARRWIEIGVLHFQPSEFAKIAVPLMISSCMNRDGYPPNCKNTILALFFTFIPTVLVASEPDLGTAFLIATSGLFVLFLSGINWKFIGLCLILIAIFMPILWFYLMHDYQRNRVITLFQPNRDLLGAGYHILQSKIAIASGGLSGKGFLKGTQAHLTFLPEQHTDFIFAVLAEEFGFTGVSLLLILYFILIIRGLILATRSQTTFGRVMSGTLMLIFFIYVFVNTGMVSGILPVVGIPLPLMSYGGSSLIVLMACFGIIMSLHGHRKFISKRV